MKKNSITTKVGDRGTTFLFSGEEVPKDADRTEAYGDLDELVSVLGVARAHAEHKEIREALMDLQRELFKVGAELATTIQHVDLIKERIDAEALARFDRQREALEGRIRMPSGFILPGGTRCAAFIDQGRAIARRLERKVVRLKREGMMRNEFILIWLNRLSDYLWLLARYEEGDQTVLK